MDKVLVTTLLTMAAVVAAVMVINTMIPALGSSGSSVLSSSSAASDRIKTNVEIITVSASASTTAVHVWIKNVGSSEVLAINQSDLFYQTETTFDRLAYNDTPTASTWRYDVEGGGTWKPHSTVHVIITLASAPASGDYLVRFVTNNGVSDEESYSV